MSEFPEWPGDVPAPEAPEPTKADEKRAETERAIQHRAELYDELAKMPSFQMFLKELEGKSEKIWRDYYALLRPAPGMLASPVDQRAIDFNQGIGEGLAYPGRIIAAAQARLKKLDEETAEEESEPDDEGGTF